MGMLVGNTPMSEKMPTMLLDTLVGYPEAPYEESMGYEAGVMLYTSRITCLQHRSASISSYISNRLRSAKWVMGCIAQFA